MTVQQSNLRVLTRGAYEIQKLRIMAGNRIIANFKAKLGQTPSAPESEIDQDGKELLASLRGSYKKLTDGMTKIMSIIDFKADEIISTFTEFCLIESFVALERDEKTHFKRMGDVLTEFPIFTEFLDGVKGIGPAMAGVIISEIDIHKARYPSSIWKYSGLDVAEDGKGRSRRKEHLIDVEYTDKNGKLATKKSITFNPFLKTKLMGVLSGGFLKVKESPYKTIYYDYKHRLENHPTYKDFINNDPDSHYTDRDLKEKNKGKKGHRHNMALRYMIKIFLIDLHREWRTLEGLEVPEPYHVAKLGLQDHRAA